MVHAKEEGSSKMIEAVKSMMIEAVKTCSGPCGRILPIAQFYNDKSKNDGLKRVCIECKNDEFRKIRERNPARAKLAGRLRSLRYVIRKRYEVTGGFTLDQVVVLWEAQQGLCYYCATTIKLDEVSLDHKISLNRGGTHSMLNLAAACQGCNFSKRDMTEAEFFTYLARGGEV